MAADSGSEMTHSFSEGSSSAGRLWFPVAMQSFGGSESEHKPA